MYSNRLFNLSIAAGSIMVMLLTACAPQAEATSIPVIVPTAALIQNEPITLRMAVSDEQGRPSEPSVLEFIEQVKTLSDGNITIEPIWDAGGDTTPSFEQGVVKVVTEGQYDLGLAGSRAWDGLGVTSFQALQAPFLITDDALAEAVASSDIATRMLDSLSLAGIAGLALWPEDLRHPFSMNPDKPILLPDDLKGLAVRSIPSEVSYMLINALGGNPIYDDGYQAAESGLRQGASLSGTPTATGNVIFFPKFQVLFANGAALEKLSEGQRSILREAAAATQKKAIAEHPSEADAAAAWCADGGTVVMASAEQVAAFEAAAKPVFDKIEQDPLNAELIVAIRDLKADTPSAPGAKACQPDVTQVQESSSPDMVNIPGTHQDELGCSAEWLPDCENTQLIYDIEDDVWQGTFEIQPANDGDKNGPRYKAAINGAWDENYGVNATLDSPDIPLLVTASTQVKFYYDHKTHWIADSFNTPIVVAMGDFQSQIGCLNDNDATCLRSWLQDLDGDGIFALTTAPLKAGTYTVIFTLNEDGNSVIGETQQFTIQKDGDVVYFGYDSVKNEMTIQLR